MREFEIHWLSKSPWLQNHYYLHWAHKCAGLLGRCHSRWAPSSEGSLVCAKATRQNIGWMLVWREKNPDLILCSHLIFPLSAIHSFMWLHIAWYFNTHLSESFPNLLVTLGLVSPSPPHFHHLLLHLSAGSGFWTEAPILQKILIGSSSLQLWLIHLLHLKGLKFRQVNRLIMRLRVEVHVDPVCWPEETFNWTLHWESFMCSEVY